MSLSFQKLSDITVVKRDGAWLGTIEQYDGEGRYAHSPDRRETFNSIRTTEMIEIAQNMKEYDE